MRKALLTLIALVLTAGSAAAQSGAWADKLFGGKTTHDFGTVARGTQLVHSFTMTNIYSVPLTITEVRTTCGCLTATPAVKTLKPKETAAFQIVMDSRRFSGPKSINVYVSVGPEFRSTATLTVSANARSDVVFNPGEFNFGVVRQGQIPAQTLDVEYAGAFDWRILEVVKPAGAPFDVTVEELYRQPPRGRQPGKAGYRLAVKLKANAEPGPLNHELILKTNEPGAGQVLSVPIEGTVQGGLAVSPRVVKLGTLKPGQEGVQKVQVRGEQPHRIAAIEGLGEGLTAEIPPESAQNHVLTVRFQSERAGEVRRVLTIRTDSGQTVTLEVEGLIAP